MTSASVLAPGKINPVPRATNVEQGIKNLDEWGVTIHENFLDAETLKAVRERFVEQMELEREQGVAWFDGEPEPGKCAPGFIKNGSHIGTPKGEPEFQNISFLVNKGRIFIDLAKNEKGLQYVRHLLGDRFNMIALSGIAVRKGSPAQDLHFDQLIIPFAVPLVSVMNIFVVLSEYDESMGATRFVPGTHRLDVSTVQDEAGRGADFGYIPHQRESVPAVAKAGDAIIWDGRIWHGQGESTDERLRMSIAMIYARPFLKPIEQFSTSISDEVYATMSAEELALFDFNADGGWGSRISPRSPTDRRHNTNAAFPYVPELRRDNNARAVRIDQMKD